jgi:predicted Zn-ribbon and HTH transcriptional regulator
MILEEETISFECKYCGFKGNVKITETGRCPSCKEESSALKRLVLRRLKE